MPVSDRYNIIFIHIPKCAGVTVCAGLGLSPCRCNLIQFHEMPAYQHLLPKELKGKYIGEARWNSYKKITIIRNPYERVISDYFWQRKNNLIPGLSFDDFLYLREDVIQNNRYRESLYYDHFYPMYFYFEDIEYDYVLRFENLTKELQMIQKIFNIEKPFPKLNETEHRDFALTKDQKKRIFFIYERDFRQFEYLP